MKRVRLQLHLPAALLVPVVNNMNRPKFLAFIKNEDSANVVKQFAAAKNFPAETLLKGNIETAGVKLAEGMRSPEFLLVELSSKDHKAAFANLDKLANSCEPDTKVIVLGDIDELSFYKELINMGVSEYLLNPVKIHQLERVTVPKAVEEKKEEAGKLGARGKGDCRIISVLGTRGGVGASTIAINMAKTFAARQYPTLILDFDPDFGVIPLLLDIEPSRGLIDALEKPERVDALFLDRVMTKVNEHLFVIGAEKSLSDVSRISDKAAQTLLELLKTRFAYVIIDIPRIEASNHYMLQHSENIIITELSIPGLRDTMRLYDLVHDSLNNKKITLVANKTGINKKFETPLKNFESGLGKKVDFSVPFEAEVYGFHNSGESLVEGQKEAKFTQAIQKIAAKFMPEAVGMAETKPKKQSLMDKLKHKK